MYGEISLLNCSCFLKNRIVKKGLCRLMDILTAEPEALSKSLKVSVNQVKDLQQDCQTLISPPVEYEAVICVPTRDADLNSSLLGGIKTQCIYELVGLPGSGRSTFAMELSAAWITAVDSAVYYLDTEGSIDIQNFKRILNSATNYERVFYNRVCTDQQLLKFFVQFEEIVQRKSLIVIDSLCFLLKETWKQEKSKARHLVKEGLKLLQKIHSKNCALVFINGFNKQQEVVFGESWASIVSKRLYFSKNTSEYFISL